MSWLDELRKRDQLLDWTEQGLLTPAQTQRALAPDHSWPAAPHWRQALDQLLAYAGSLLLALGVIFFFAFNWDDLHRLHKLLLALTVLSGFAGAALCLPRDSTLYRACLFGAALATGGTLALVGQIYQTGADIWQLFAIWAVLILPWALLSRSAACWGLFWVVGNLALLRYFAVHHGLPGMNSSGVRMLLGLALVYMTVLPCYLQLRRDLLILALLAYALVGVASFGLARWLIGNLDDFVLLNLLGLFVLGASALATLWLHQLHRGQQT